MLTKDKPNKKVRRMKVGKRIFLLSLVLFCILFLFTTQLTSADYYVVLDQNMSSLESYARKIADFHNGVTVISNFSDLEFLKSDDQVLFIVNYSKFNANFVYSIYNNLDFNNDGIYDPIIGFYPVKSKNGFIYWVNSLTSSKLEYGALFICPSCPSKIKIENLTNGKAYFLEGDSASYENYLKYSQNTSLIWITGHGSPYGINLITWRFNKDYIRNPKGKVFIFESCSVGMIWQTKGPLVLDLLNNGSLVVIASVDTGGVSYLENTLWLSNYSLGKLVQINNAYFKKVGVNPKVVLFGDPAIKIFKEKGFSEISINEAGILKFLFPKIDGYVYIPSDEKLSDLRKILLAFKIYGNIFNPLDLWRSIVTQNGIFGIIMIIALVVLGSNFNKIDKKNLVISLLSALAVFFGLSLFFDSYPLTISMKIMLSWALVLFIVLTFDKIKALPLLLFLPVLLFIFAAWTIRVISLRYAIFALIVGIVANLFISGLLYGVAMLLRNNLMKPK